MKRNDKRINLIEISNGLKNALYDAGFTVESILNNEPSKIANALGIDEYVGKIIINETKKIRIFNKRFFNSNLGLKI